MVSLWECVTCGCMGDMLTGFVFIVNISLCPIWCLISGEFASGDELVEVKSSFRFHEASVTSIRLCQLVSKKLTYWANAVVGNLFMLEWSSSGGKWAGTRTQPLLPFLPPVLPTAACCEMSAAAASPHHLFFSLQHRRSPHHWMPPKSHILGPDPMAQQAKSSWWAVRWQFLI